MKAILSILLSGYFLAGNIHLMIGTHLCGGHAVKTELLMGHAPLSCGMTDADDSCEKKREGFDDRVVQKECCQNIYKAVYIEDDYNKRVKTDFSFLSSLEISDYPVLISNRNSAIKHRFKPDRGPPDISKNIQVLFQTFLI